MAYYNSPNPIYNIHYSKIVTAKDEFIGMDVKVVRGRKFPIGTILKIKSFWTYYINQWKKTTYIVAETGEKVPIVNVELVKPRCYGTIKESWIEGQLDDCPNCKSKDVVYCGSGYDGVMDLYIGHCYCKKCGLELRFRDL